MTDLGSPTLPAGKHTSVEAALYERRQRRRDKVMMITLVEVLTIFLFIMMAFALVAQSEVVMAHNLRQQLDALRVAHRELQLRLAMTERERDRYLRQRNMLLHMYNLDRFVDHNDQLDDFLNDPRRRSLTYPVCPAPTGFMLRIDLLPDGSFQARPAWPAAEQAAATSIPGVASLINAGPIGAVHFAQLAGVVRLAGERRPEACRFLVSAVAQHENLRLYLQQLPSVEQQFRTRRVQVSQ